MSLAQAKTTKEKVTVTLNPRLIRAIDRWCRKAHLRSRSAAIEHLVERSIDEDEKSGLESATEAYYLSLSSEERREDRSWTKLSSNQALRRSEKD